MPCSSDSIVDFEKVNNRWDSYYITVKGTVMHDEKLLKNNCLRVWNVSRKFFSISAFHFSYSPVRCVISFITYLWRNIYALFEFEFNHIAVKQVLKTVQGTNDGCSSMLNKYWQKCKQPMIGVLRNKRS